MARKATIKVADFPELKEEVMYRVVAFHIEKKRSSLVVQLRNLDPQQEDREHRVELPLPPRPTGRTAQFLKACGQEVKVGAEVVLDDLVGKTLHVTFARECEDMKVASFSAIRKEHSDVSAARS